MKKTLTILAAAALMATIAATAQAQTILYQDDFSGSSSDALNGTIPDITIGSNVWSTVTNADGSNSNFTTDTAIWKADGSQVGNSYNGGINLPGDYHMHIGMLPFIPQSGEVYTLSATLTTIPNGQGLALGFGKLDAFQYPWNNPGADSTIRLDSWGSTQSDIYTGNRIPDGGFSHYGQSAVGLVSSIVLDTRPALWTASDYYGGVLMGTYTLNAYEMGAIDNVQINKEGYNGAGTVANFSLVQAASVPEPGAYAMMLGGLGMLLGMQKFRSRKA